MKFDTPAGRNPIDRMRVVGKAHDRVDGPLKVSGRAPYAYERHDITKAAAYGYIVGAAIAKGRIRSFDLAAAKKAPGVLGIVTHENAGKLGHAKASMNVAKILAGPDVEHYHQAVAIIVAGTFEEARHAAGLIKIDYEVVKGSFDLAAIAKDKPTLDGAEKPEQLARVGDFNAAFEAAPVKLDQTYITSDESHSMMEPHATTAAWEGDTLRVWTSNQMITWSVRDLSATLLIPPEKIRVESPFIGGGFGGKLRIRSDVIMAALASREVGKPVKVALQRPLIMNNTGRRAGTRQRVRLGATTDGKLTAIYHEGWSGTLPGGRPEAATIQTDNNYGQHAARLIGLQKAVLDLVESDSMRAPGEAPGHMAIEVAIDELAEQLGMDTVEFRILNDTPIDPVVNKPFSSRHLVECLRRGAERFGWADRKPKPAQTRQGRWLIGMGVAGAFRNNPLRKSGARVRLEHGGRLTVETDMTDIGTGSYTILGQTAAEMMGLPLGSVKVKLGDSTYPSSAGSGGQFGAVSSTAGLYAACVKLREAIAKQLGFDPATTEFTDGMVVHGDQSVPLASVVRDAPLVAEDAIEFDPAFLEAQPQVTFGAHFVEVGVHAYTGETRVRRMLAVCSAGRILNPKTARSQMIGAMVMGVGEALMEHMALDKQRGFFANHDLAGYEVPCHADIPQQEVIFLDTLDPRSSPMKAMGVGELGIVGVGAAVANAIYHATGVRVREYPITSEKLIDALPAVAS